MASFILEGTLTVFLISGNFTFIMCGTFERKENDFWEQKNLIYSYEPAIKNGQVHHLSLQIKIYMIYFLKHSSELIYALRKINSKCNYFGSLALLMSFLQDCFGG